MDRETRAATHAAMGDPHRLHIVDDLLLGDLTPRQLSTSTGLSSNLLAHHLAVLEGAGLIERRPSSGDQRRRYVTLVADRLSQLVPHRSIEARSVLFVCTRNAARSQFAAALWRRRSGLDAQSAGTHPARRVDAKAVRAAAADGIDLATAVPRGYASVADEPDLVVSVCDRAGESALPPADGYLHWSVPDPFAAGTMAAFRAAYEEIAERVGRLADSIDTQTRGGTTP